VSGKLTTKRSKKLGELLGGVVLQVSTAFKEVHITGITSDSRMVQPGDLFTAIKGLTADGHDYIDAAIERGCSAVVAQQGSLTGEQFEKIARRIPAVLVRDSQESLGHIAAVFYDRPAEQLSMIGITGTNGKTTTSFLIESIIKAGGGRPGVIGTVNYRYCSADNNPVKQPAPFTTPEPAVLHHILRQMADAGTSHVIMEVSSHALVQKRLSGLLFDAAVFTNLSHDHLDFHGDMHRYFAGKKILFQQHLKDDGAMVVQLESQEKEQERRKAETWGRNLAQEIDCKMHRGEMTAAALLTCGIDRDATVFPLSFAINLDGIKAKIQTPAGEIDISSSLTGTFNLKNILSAVSAAVALGIDKSAIAGGIAALQSVPGRLERISVKGTDGPTVFVDYAHTPDALQNVLQTLHHCGAEKIICVFGCGGDRDREKRPLMGSIAGRLADIIIITNDNPRSEPPAEILRQIETGISGKTKKITPGQSFPDRGYLVIGSRRQAIQTAILLADCSDVVVISGKGHEDYQIVGNDRSYFDDRIEAEIALKQLLN
jgi:UDP-N-acetylmuramyl-tripeptide synthetase